MGKVDLPKDFDPYDMDLKRQYNPQADKMNWIRKSKGTEACYLACGAKNSKGEPCTLRAGQSTPHKGHGRCKFHGGLSTGPVTEQGIENIRKASLVHGLYSQVLSPQEKEIFKTLTDDEKTATDLTFEITLLKTKIISYLSRYREKWDTIAEQEGQDMADYKTRVWFSTGENGKGVRSYYHAATIEDRALDRTLNTLARLIEKQIKITGEDRDDILDTLNAELRAASRGNIAISWGGPAQNREAAAANRPPVREDGDPVE